LKLATGERYEPDLFVLPAENGRRPVLDDLLVQPILICESLSPGSSRHDRITKRRAFQRNDVPTYWIIDGDAEAFEVWRSEDERAPLVAGQDPADLSSAGDRHPPKWLIDMDRND
jgi:Uma2 family endonuclease